MAQNVNPAASSSSAGYDKDSMERKSATSSTQVSSCNCVSGTKFYENGIPNFVTEELYSKLLKII